MSDYYDPPEGDKVAVNFSDPEVQHGGEAVPLSFRKYPPYESPAGDQVGLNFSPAYQPPDLSEPVILEKQRQSDIPETFSVTLTQGDYTPPFGANVGLEFAPTESGNTGEDQYVFPVGGGPDSVFGQPEAYLYSRYIEPEGQVLTKFGAGHNTWNYWTFARPGGFDHLAVSNGALIKNLNRYYPVDGFNAAGFGDHFLRSTFFDVFPEGNAHGSAGKPAVELGAHRYYLDGFDASQAGNATVENLTKQAWPEGAEQSGYGQPTLENARIVTRVDGFLATGFGEDAPVVWNLRQIIRGRDFDASRWGSTFVQGGEVTIEPSGFYSQRVNRPRVYDPQADQYIELDTGIPAPPFGWVNLSPRTIRPSGALTGLFGDPALEAHFPEENAASTVGWDAGAVGGPLVQHLNRVVRPDGIESAVFGATEAANYAQGVTVPEIKDTGVFGDTLLYNKRIEVSVPGFDALEVPIWTTIYSNRRFLLGSGFASQAFGNPETYNYTASIKTWGSDLSGFGRPNAGYFTRFVQGLGSDYGSVGEPGIRNWEKHTAPDGIASQLALGRPYVWNLLQIRRANGFYSAEFGRPFLQGGVKYVYAGAGNESSIPRPEVVNTTADQGIRVRGIEAPAVSRVIVSPRFVHLESFDASGQGEPTVQFPPMPEGWVSSVIGQHSIREWTTWTYPEGWDSAAVGFPEPRDRAQAIFTPSILGTGIFGDIQARNNRLVITVDGQYFFESSDFAEVRSNRRALEGRGFDAQAFGGTGIRNKTPSFAPIGSDLAEFGLASIGYFIRYIYGRGVDYLAFGRPELDKTPSIAPKGMEGEAGKPTVWRSTRRYQLDGIDSLDVGGATVWYRVRKLQAGSAGKVRPAYGTPRLEHGNRQMLAQGDAHTRYGRPRLSNANRWVYPKGYFEEFAVVHRVGGTQVIEVFGFSGTAFGDRIVPPVRRIEFEQGFFSQQIPWPELYNQTTVLEPKGITTGQQPADRWGVGGVFNAIQHIELYYYHESGLNPPEGARWTLIENRNKTLGTSGTRFDRHGNATLEHAARLLKPAGIEPPDPGEFYQSGMVGYRVRELPIHGMEPPYISGWNRVYNDAFVIAPDGLRGDVYGDAEAKTLRRYFKGIGRFDAAEYGTPMIADRVRELWIEPRYTIGAPRINLHTVDLYTRYIEAGGEDLSQHSGWHDLISRFNRITTRWSHSDAFGWSTLRNLTPELGIYGAASDVYGDTHVRLEWRQVNGIGSRTELFGGASVADRDRSMSVRGFKAGQVSDRLEVIQGGQPPYTDQHIDLKGHGAMDPNWRDQVPEPSLNLYVLEMHGFKTEAYGDPFIQSNAIIVGDEPPHDGYGTPRVWRMLQTVHVGAGPGIMEPSKPVVSPHTIWARPTTNQARKNHNPPGQPWEPVGKTRIYPPGERFGNHRISTYRGEVYQRWTPSPPRPPRPRLSLMKRYIAVEGIRSYRAGWQKLGDGSQEVEQFGGRRFDVFGEVTVKRPPYTGPQWVTVDSVSGNDVGRPKAEHFHREIYPKGSRMDHMGYSHGGPYQYQGLAVHPPMPTIPEGFDAYRASEEHWIAPRVREVKCQGYETFASEYDLMAFAKRMTVRNAYVPTPPKQEVAPVGMDVSGTGVPNVMPAVHFIKPDGNADQFRKGGY